MITLSKTHKPLHTMTHNEVSSALDDYNSLVSVAHNAEWDNRWRSMRNVYAAELVRRIPRH